MSREEFESRVRHLDNQKQTALRKQRKEVAKIPVSTGIWNGWRFLLGVVVSAAFSALAFRVVQEGSAISDFSGAELTQQSALIMLIYLAWFFFTVLGVVATFALNWRNFGIPMCSPLFLGAMFTLLVGLAIMNMVDCNWDGNCMRAAVIETFS